MKDARYEKLTKIAGEIENMVRNYGRRDDISIRFAVMTEEELALFTEWDQQWLGLIYNEEMFIISEPGHNLYAVNVSGDSLLTAAYELMRVVSAKF